WKFADIILLTGHAFVALSYIAFLFITQKKSLEKFVKSAFMISLAAASLVKIFHWKFAFELSLISLILLLFYLGLLAFKFFRERKQKTIPPPDTENNL
ncbi:MAG: hypothetical protein ACXWEY_07715, partial [Bacteroidia bacterium]